MKAGHAAERRDPLSVRPKFVENKTNDVMANEGESDAEEIEGTVGDEEIEKIKIPREKEVIRKIADPMLPTKSEVDMHNVMGHTPFRSWCPICVKAQGRDWDHGKDGGRERKLPEYSWDYCFPGNEFGYKWTVLGGKKGSRKARWRRRYQARGWCKETSALTNVWTSSKRTGISRETLSSTLTKNHQLSALYLGSGSSVGKGKRWWKRHRKMGPSRKQWSKWYR